MRLAGAIFDLDGTLADTLPVCFAAFRSALARLGVRHHGDEEIRALFGPSEECIIRQIVPDRWQDAVVGFLAEYDRHLPLLCAGVFPAVSSPSTSCASAGSPWRS